MSNPYEQLTEKAFWRSAVAARSPFDIADLWEPKFEIVRDRPVATLGSCFAQHISNHLRAHSFQWLDAETPPRKLDAASAKERGYGIFSARTGNIYTAAALRQWMSWALGKEAPPDEVWTRDGRYFDPFRPAIEPQGFDSPAAVRRSRTSTLKALAKVAGADVIVFTMGLTEAWIHRTGGHVYAVCPGTVGGEFDPKSHAFHNYGFAEIHAHMQAALAVIREANSGARFLLTVSPVPLTATASGQHVLVANQYSKSVLRAVAGQLAQDDPGVDYFPSFEIITAAPFRSMFYEPNLRSVTSRGVGFVMESFLAGLLRKSGPRTAPRAPLPEAEPPGTDEDDVACEEALLAEFEPGRERAAPRSGTTRLGVIGDSHLAALRAAVGESTFAERELDVTFWGFPAKVFHEVRCKDGALVPPDLAPFPRLAHLRPDALRPIDFDALLFVGGGIKPSAMIATCRKGHADLRDLDQNGLLEVLRRRVGSRDVVVLMRAVRERYKGQILYAPTPAPSDAAAASATERVEDGELQHLNDALARMLAEQGVVYLPQPPETMRHAQWTESSFASPGTVGRNGVVVPDHRHMNERYGALVLTAAQNVLRAKPQ